MTERYKNIIDMPHHVSETHPPMSRGNRAAQFAPYAALVGYGDAVCEEARLTEREIELDEYERDRIDRIISEYYESRARARITFFVPDASKSGGHYESAEGYISKIDRLTEHITLNGEREINVNKILEIERTISGIDEATK